MLAPIVLFVYNRPHHARTTLRALAANSLATQSNLIIFSDSAKNEHTVSAVNEVRGVIADIPGFSSVRVVHRDINFGLAKSVISGVTEIIEEFGKVIVLEDDLVTSIRFLEYMNAALDFYQNDEKAFSIGGYQFPKKTMTIPSEYRWDTYASYRCCSWAWATWKRRWQQIDWRMNYFDDFIADAASQARFNRGGPDMTQLLTLQRQGRIDSWAIRFCFAHFANDMHCIYPVKSLVNNIGLDNSGMHCGIDPRRQHDKLDDVWLPTNFCRADAINPTIAAGFYKAFCAPSEQNAVPSVGLLMRQASAAARILWLPLRSRLGRLKRALFRVV